MSSLIVEIRAATLSLLWLGELTTLIPTLIITTVLTLVLALVLILALVLVLELELLQYRMYQTVQTVEELWRK